MKPNKRNSRLVQTPSQTIGPFFSYGLTPEQYGYAFPSLAGPSALGGSTGGESITLEGNVFDGAGEPITDALVEIWQADTLGRYAHPADLRASNQGFHGYARMGTGTDAQARFEFTTVKPGSIDDEQAPHINVCVFMRGLLSHVFTRVYFEDEAPKNASDSVLNSVPAARRETLIARRQPNTNRYRFDIRMQGPDETVFFDL